MKKKILVVFLITIMCFVLIGCDNGKVDNNLSSNDENNTNTVNDKPTSAMYKTDSKGNKVIDTSLDVIELEEHSITMNNNKATDKKTDNIYKITNAKGKEFSFGEFRHL